MRVLGILVGSSAGTLRVPERGRSRERGCCSLRCRLNGLATARRGAIRATHAGEPHGAAGRCSRMQNSLR